MSRRQVMNISNLPTEPMTDRAGNLSASHRQFFNQLVNQTQTFLGNGTYVLPSQTTADIGTIQNKNALPAILHDSEQQNAKINTNGNYNIVVTYDGELTTTEINAIPSGKRNGRVFWDTTTNQLKMGGNDTFIVIG